MKKTRIFSLLLAVMLAATIISGCRNNTVEQTTTTQQITSTTTTQQVTSTTTEETMLGNMYKTGLPIVKDKVTFKIATAKREEVKKEYNELLFFKKYEEDSNINIEWVTTPRDAWKERVTLMFASQELPDAFYGAESFAGVDYEALGSDGQLIPLEELIEKWAPLYNNALTERPFIRIYLTALDGHMYTMGSIDEEPGRASSDAPYINKKWLDEANLPIPTTIDEFYNALKTIKQNHPDSTMLTFVWKHDVTGVKSLMFGPFGIIARQNHFFIKDGELVFDAIQPEYKEALKNLNMFYKEGLIDPESFTHTVQVFRAKVGNNDVGAFVDWNSIVPIKDAEKLKEYVPFAPLKGPEGHQIWDEALVRPASSFAITKECKSPEILMRWIDLSYEEERSVEAFYGPIGVNMKLNAEGKYEWLPTPEGYDAISFRHIESPGIGSAYMLLSDLKVRFVDPEGTVTKRALTDMARPYFPKDPIPLVFKIDNEIKTQMAVLAKDIIDYTDNTIIKWITEGNIDNEWEGFVKKLNDMGLDEYMKPYKDYYETFKKSLN